MPNVKTCLTGVILGLAVVVSASPGLAKERVHSKQKQAAPHARLYNQAAPQERLYNQAAPQGGLSTTMDGAREQALRECNTEVAPWNNRDFQAAQIVRYNGCMQQRGQMP
jgi:hypothetical protein